MEEINARGNVDQHKPANLQTYNSNRELSESTSASEVGEIQTDTQARYYVNQSPCDQFTDLTIQSLSDPEMDTVDSKAAYVADDSTRCNQQSDGNKIMKYRPLTAIPPSRGRLARTTSPPENETMLASQWPPPEMSKFDKTLDVNVVPPRNSPLHVHIQAYALRWGHWAARIEDRDRRQEVLKWVTNQMRQAWETAVREGYYTTATSTSQVNQSNSTSAIDEVPVSAKRPRKRAIDSSKQPAGLVYEGRDQHAITKGELNDVGVTLDMIKRRSQIEDFTEVEMLLDEVLSNLGRDIAVRDWSVNRNRPVVHGRNLLMYCLYTVQQCRLQISKLRVLHKNFSTDHQKRNTQTRIDTYREREQQHLALAAELNLQQQSLVKSEQADSNERSPSISEVSMQHQRKDVSVVSITTNNSQPVSPQDSPIIPEESRSVLLLNLAKDVLGADTQPALQAAFDSRSMKGEDFNGGPGLENNDQNHATVKQILSNIFEHVTWITAIHKHIQQIHDPKERIRIGHDVQLSNFTISQYRQQLHNTLNMASGKTVDGRFVVEEQLNSQDLDQTAALHNKSPLKGDAGTFNLAPNSPYRPAHQPNNFGNTMQPAVKAKSEDLNSQDKFLVRKPEHNLQHTSLGFHPSVFENTPATVRPTDLIAFPNDNSLRSATNSASPSQTHSHILSSSGTSAKHVYTDEIWLPKVNYLLRRAGQPQFQGVLNNWNGIKAVLTSLDYDTNARNKFLRSFKAGFEHWSTQHATSATGAGSGDEVVNSHQGRSMPWPDQSEVLTLLSYGSMTKPDLVSFYTSACEGQKGKFLDWINSFTKSDGKTGMIYPSQKALIYQWQKSIPGLSMSLVDNTQKHNAYYPTGVNEADENLIQSPTLKLSIAQQSKKDGVVKLKVAQARDFGDYSSKIPNTVPRIGFAFRFFPTASMDQRRRLEDLINDYITKIRTAGLKTRPFGQYVRFGDPEDPDGDNVAHGFWNLKNGQRPEGSEWFFNGKEMPRDWDEQGSENGCSAGDIDDKTQAVANTGAKTLKRPAGSHSRARSNVRKTKKRKVIKNQDGDSDSDYTPPI